MVEKNRFNIQANEPLVKRATFILSELLACHSFFVYFLQHEKTRIFAPSWAYCSLHDPVS